MEDQIISSETAKSAKKKGLDQKSEIIYTHFYVEKNSKVYGVDEKVRYYPVNNEYKKLYKVGEYVVEKVKNIIPAYTQSLLHKWLREKHFLFVEVKASMGDYYFVIIDVQLDPDNVFKRRSDPKTCLSYAYTTYEEALEEGLKEALNLI